MKKELSARKRIMDRRTMYSQTFYNSAPKYINPDGTPRSDRPKDGESATYLGPGPHYNTVWTWDDFAQAWFKNGNTASYGAIGSDTLIEIELKEANKITKECECGSEKVGSSSHSTYCPKYES